VTVESLLVFIRKPVGLSVRACAVIPRPALGYADREALPADAGERPHARATLKAAYRAGISGMDPPVYQISRHPAELGEPEVLASLTHLAAERRVW